MKRYFKSLFLFLIFFSISNIFSQQNRALTHIMAPWEKELMRNFPTSFYETPPPQGEVRNIAEWEPMESVIVAYTGEFGVPLSLIAEMSQDCKITTIVANAGEENTVHNIYTNNGVNTANCDYVYQDPNSYWTRDYSPWFIAVDDSEVAIVNFPYNRPRPNDNDVPILMANTLNLDLYGMNITHTGGNYMCDGYGVGASTDLVWEENTSLTHAEINAKMQDYLGIETYHVTLDPLDDYIKHIDCWGKFLDVDKVLITQVPATDYRYDDYEAVANYFATQNCSWGYPYEVIRVQASDRSQGDINPYTNALILNNKVFVPQTGSALDADAIAVYQNAMPGYEIHGVYSDSWANTDALHCRTHGIADREMLYIQHFPYHGEVAFQNNFTIEAKVLSYGGSPISSGYPVLHYKQNNSNWEQIVMTSSGNDIYTASIPGLSGNNTVSYYIEAQNDNGKTEKLPRMGDLDPFEFSYTTASVISIAAEGNINVYPNPAVDFINITSTEELKEIQIYNLSGQKLISVKTQDVNFRLEIENLKSGVYFMLITDANSHFAGLEFIVRKE